MKSPDCWWLYSLLELGYALIADFPERSSGCARNVEPQAETIVQLGNLVGKELGEKPSLAPTNRDFRP